MRMLPRLVRKWSTATLVSPVVLRDRDARIVWSNDSPGYFWLPAEATLSERMVSATATRPIIDPPTYSRQLRSATRFCRARSRACRLFLSEGARRNHFLFDRRAAATHHVRLHREVLRQTESIHALRGTAIALLDTLPEFAIVLAGEWRAILLRLVLEDRHFLRA